MSISLKDLNRPLLILVVVANVAAYFLVSAGDFSVTAIKSALLDIEGYAPATLIAVVVGVLNAQLDPILKARIVFWRWRHPLPGCFAFTKYVASDPRIDSQALNQIDGSLPTDPEDQNRLWFKWYREFQNEPSVLQVHREFLFTRDWASLLVLMAVGLVPLGYWQMGVAGGSIFAGLILIQYILVMIAARNHGVRFVTNVLACKSSSL